MAHLVYIYRSAAESVPTVIDSKLRRATMWSAMSREVSYKGIANAIAVFLATSAG